MLQAFERYDHIHSPVDDSITLDYDTRKKARIKGMTDKGQAIGIFMERGHPLLVGEFLKTQCGLYIEIKGEAEEVSTAVATNWLNFAKVCYHLGNRHTTLQVGELWVRFKPDHVLEELAENYGLTIDRTPAIFSPENGAYAKGGHSHGHHHHDDEHDHSDHKKDKHEHKHDHGHHHDH